MPYLHVSPVGLPEEVGFNPHAPFAGCKICGEVYQSDLDRKIDQTPHENIQALVQRRNWTFAHARTHADHEHRSLELSGRFCTPEAAYKLATFGVVSLPTLDDDETPHAQRLAPKLPTDSPQS